MQNPPITQQEFNFKVKSLVVSLSGFMLKTFILSLAMMCFLVALLSGLSLIGQSHQIANAHINTLVESLDSGSCEQLFRLIYPAVILWHIGLSKFWKSKYWRL
jgi:hypothetical protein